MDAEALDVLALRQHGLFTGRQALAIGLTSKEIEGGARSGQWPRIHRGVYRVRGAPRTQLQSLLAAVLAAGPGAMASHRGAAWLWGLTKEPRLEVGGHRHHRPATGSVVYHRLSGEARPVLRRAVPCTDPLLTVVHLAGLGNESLLLASLDRGIASGLFSAAAVGAELGRRSGKGVAGVRALRGVIARRLEAEGERTSDLESAMDRLIVSHGLPVPERQYQLGGTRYRLDYAWPAARLVVEVDGYSDHSSLDVFRYDRERQNALVLAGWTVLRFTWADVRDRPRHVADQIRRALGDAGLSAC